MKRLSLVLGFLSACSSGALPELPPVATEFTPNQVQIIGIWPTDGDEQLRPPVLVVGQAYKLKVRVRALGDRPLSSEPLVASIASDSFERVISFPRGDTCITPAEPESDSERGVCTIVFYAEGLVRDVAIRVRAQRALAVTDRIDLDLQADIASARLRFVVPGVGTATWLPGDADPLAALQRMGLSLEEDQAVPLVVELKDAYDNPLVGQRVELTDWLEPQGSVETAPDAGAVVDGGGSVDTSLAEAGNLDASIGDASTRDAQLLDASLSDTQDASVIRDASNPASDASSPADVNWARLDSGTSFDSGIEDAGSGAVGGALANGRVLLYRHDGVRCSTEPYDDERYQALSDPLGRATFCLKAGEVLGAWQLVIKLAELIDPQTIAARSQDGFVLSGRTRAGDPDRLILLGHENEGDEPLSRCEAGDVTPLEYFQVLSAGGRPVEGAEVNVSVEGAVRLLSSANALSDDQGRIAVQVSCPITMPSRSTIRAKLVGASLGETRKQALLYVRLEVQRIERLRLMVDQPGQALLSLGRGRAFEPMYFRVLAEGSRGTPAADSRLNLKVLTSQDNNDLFFLSNDRCDAQPERSVHNHSVYTDADGVFRFAVCGVGLSTVLRPMSLVVRAHGQLTQLQVPITLIAGDPVRVLADPPGRVTTMVGGAAGALDVVVQDEAGNGVPGAAVEIVRPPSIELTGCADQCTTLEGVTNAIGRYSAWISRVTSEGEHDLTLRASKGAWSGVTAKTVVAGVGAATALGFYRDDRLLVPLLGAPQVEVPVGGALEQPLALRLENRVGGGVVDEGIAVSLIEGEPNQCGRIGLEGRVTNEAGEIVFGGDQGVPLEAGMALGDCMWRFSAGVDVQTILRVRQVAGAPFGGRPEMDQGTVLTALQQSPTDWNQGGNLTAEVRVQARDRFGNPKVGLSMWLNATNCWIEEPLQRLNAQGEGVWRVAGGRDHNQPCTLHMRYAGGEWQEAQPLVIPIQGLPVPIIHTLSRLVVEHSASHHCPRGTTFQNNGCYIRGGHWVMTEENERRYHVVLRIDDELVIRPDTLRAQQSAICFEPDLEDPYARCSRVEVLDVEEGENGDKLYAPIATIPIRWRVVRPDQNANRTLEFHVMMPQQLVADGREKALRVVQPDGQTVGPPEGIFIQPPIRWHRQVTRLVNPDNPQEQARIWGGHRLQLDDDEAQEAVFCGNDDQGGLLAVIDRQHRSDPYPQTLQGIRLWSLDSNAKMPQASRADLACALGDLDDDGRKDLVIPLPTSAHNRVPRMMLLRGLAQAPFFDVENAVVILLTSAPAYPAYPPSQVVVSQQPNRIWVCFGALKLSTYYQGGCENDGAKSVYIQSNPFTENPNQALGAQTAHPKYPVLPIFQVADQVYFEGLGTVTSQGTLVGQSKPWPEQPLSQSGAILRANHFDETTRIITTVSEAGVVRRWDHHGALLAEFRTPQESGNAVFTSDGRMAATVVENVIYVWRTADGSVLFTVRGDLPRWTPTNAEYPDPVLLAGDRVSIHGSCHHHSRSAQLDLRTYSASGELMHEFVGAVPRTNHSCATDNHWSIQGTAGAELVYAHRSKYNVQRLNGRTGERLADFTLADLSPNLAQTNNRSIQWLYFNADRSRAFVRVYHDVHNAPYHTLHVAMPSGQRLWEVCRGNDRANPGCNSRWNTHGLTYSPDHRIFTASDATTGSPSNGWWRGTPHDPWNDVRFSGYSNTAGYMFLTEAHHSFADSRRNLHVYPIDQTPGGLYWTSYASPQQITARARHPQSSNFYFGTHVVPQEQDHGDVMILPRRRYRHGRTNQFYDNRYYGAQWGYTDAYAHHDISTFVLGDGEIIVARPTTWRPECGNGRLDPGELIDTGQPWRGRWDCGASLVASCGNGVVDDGEACDDGNNQAGDGCVGCLRTFAGLRQDEPLASCAALSDEAASGSYWVGQPGDARFTYCKRASGVWYELVARFANADGAQWRGANWTAREHSFGDCSLLETGATARDCRSRGWDRIRGDELLIAEHLNLNDQVYEGLRVFRLTQPGTMAQLAQAPANADLLASTQLLAGGDNTLAFATVDDPPHLLVNYDLGDDGCRLATSTKSGQCTSGLACRTNNRDEYCFGDVNTDQRDTRNYNWFSRYGMTEQTIHLFIRPLED